MNLPLSYAEGISFINSLISGSETKEKVLKYFKERCLHMKLDDGEPCELGKGRCRKFVIRNIYRLKTSNGDILNKSRSKWSACIHFFRKHDLECKTLAEAKIQT